MNEPELEQFEQELRALRPARPPAELMARLAAARPEATIAHEPRPARGSTRVGWGPWLGALDWRLVLRWAVPVTALAIGVGLVWVRSGSGPREGGPPLARVVPAMIKADSVQLDQQLVDSFDAVGRLPSGEPVRFRYQHWVDQLVVRDKSRGVLIEQRTPRVEVVPVRFETY